MKQPLRWYAWKMSEVATRETLPVVWHARLVFMLRPAHAGAIHTIHFPDINRSLISSSTG